MRRRPAAMAVVGLASVTMLSGQPAPPPGELTYEIRLIERPVGFERVRITKEPYGQRLESHFEISDRGTPIKVDSNFMVSPDLTPIAAEIIGKTYRFVNVDTSVLVEGGRASIRHSGATSATRVDGPYFIARGYAPLAARAWLVKYWETHGRPRVLRALPESANDGIRIESRGDDRVRVGGQAIRLRRYSVDGVVWGRETVWLDDEDRLAGIVTRIHILPMEAIRSDLKDAFDTLQIAAVADQMEDLTAMRAAVAPVAPEGTWALSGGRIVSGAGPPLDDATIVVEGGRISAVGPRVSTPVPAGARVIQGRGTTAIPGLWDMHAHAANIEWAPAYLAAGVTTIRDMGGETRYLISLRGTFERTLGLRFLLAGLVDGPGDTGFGTTIAATAEEARTIVDSFRAVGFQQVKLYTLLAPDVVSAITARAHELKMTVTGHVPRALTPEQGLERGMDQIAHQPVRGDPQSAEARQLIAALARRQTVLDPTLSWTELLGRGSKTVLDKIEPRMDRVPKPLAENYRSVVNERDTNMIPALASVKAMHTAGVPIVVGTDGAIPGLSVLREIELLHYAGLTPQQAIDAATRVPAKVMGVLEETGTIEVGKRADLLVLDGDPLADIINIRYGRWVAIGGRLYACSDLARLAGFKPR